MDLTGDRMSGAYGWDGEGVDKADRTVWLLSMLVAATTFRHTFVNLSDHVI
jgi:hypothetical protein